MPSDPSKETVMIEQLRQAWEAQRSVQTLAIQSAGFLIAAEALTTGYGINQRKAAPMFGAALLSLVGVVILYLYREHATPFSIVILAIERALGVENFSVERLRRQVKYGRRRLLGARVMGRRQPLSRQFELDASPNDLELEQLLKFLTFRRTFRSRITVLILVMAATQLALALVTLLHYGYSSL